MKRLILLLFLVACDSTITAPANSQRLEITAEYRTWWGEMESCSGIQSNIDAVAFYVVAGMDRETGAAGRTDWDNSGHVQIVLDSLFLHSAFVVKHEMVHALIRQKGHPDYYFRGVCGNLIDPWND